MRTRETLVSNLAKEYIFKIPSQDSGLTFLRLLHDTTSYVKFLYCVTSDEIVGDNWVGKVNSDVYLK